MGMPPVVQNLMQNRNAMIAVIAVVLVVLVGGGWMMFSNKGDEHASGNEPLSGAKLMTDEQMKLTTVEYAGKAIEIQALMARAGLRMNLKGGDGGKVEIWFMDGATLGDRDRAIITLVQSGLMDRNVGLESFDKGDLTASREEKRIKLIRAQQGEMARLIRKIQPIEDASVALSIPEPTIFKSEMKPMSASVQVTLPIGVRLERDKIRSIINLMVGSIQGLDAQHVALSDTNGTTYNSVLDAGSEMRDKLEDQDQYMKQKVSSQLDKLVGAGHYVVTVSTLLREAAKETMVQTYDPAQSAVSSKQSFVEKLNANSGKNGMATGGPTSAMLPRGMDSTLSSGGGGTNQRGYTRNGVEVSYANGKTQWVETSMPGMVEDISVAVTIDKDYMPGMSMDSLQQLVAHAASPKINPESVSIALTDFQKPASFGLKPANQAQTPDASSEGGLWADLFGGDGDKDYSWVLWGGGSVVAVVVLLLAMSMFKGAPKNAVDSAQWQQSQMEFQQLKEYTAQQMSALQASQQQTQLLLEQQRQMLATQPAMPQQSLGQIGQPGQSSSQTDELRQTLAELKETVQQKAQDDDEDLDLQIKSWIEST